MTHCCLIVYFYCDCLDHYLSGTLQGVNFNLLFDCMPKPTGFRKAFFQLQFRIKSYDDQKFQLKKYVISLKSWKSWKNLAISTIMCRLLLCSVLDLLIFVKNLDPRIRKSELESRIWDGIRGQ
jgi:hypothetical protein